MARILIDLYDVDNKGYRLNYESIAQHLLDSVLFYVMVLLLLLYMVPLVLLVM